MINLLNYACDTKLLQCCIYTIYTILNAVHLILELRFCDAYYNF